MSNALPPLPMLGPPSLVDAGVRGLKDNANRLGLTWGLIPATVTNGTYPLETTVVCDGDTKPIVVTSMLGYPLVTGQRVYIAQVPPGGLFIIGLQGPNMGLSSGELIAWNLETADSAGFTTTPTRIGSVTAYLVPGYTYNVTCNAQLVSTGTDIYQATLYVGGIAGPNELQAGRFPSQTSDQARPNIIPLSVVYQAGVTGPAGLQQFTVTGHRVSGGGTVRRSAGLLFPQYTKVYLDKTSFLDPVS